VSPAQVTVLHRQTAPPNAPACARHATREACRRCAAYMCSKRNTESAIHTGDYGQTSGTFDTLPGLTCSTFL